jgi:hypothetical protein
MDFLPLAAFFDSVFVFFPGANAKSPKFHLESVRQ